VLKQAPVRAEPAGVRGLTWAWGIAAGLVLTVAPSSAAPAGLPIAGYDFDGDGAADAVIGAPGDLAGAGVVHVIYGAAGSGPTGARDQLWQQGHDGVPGLAAAGDGFGAALSGGDLDGDGYDDLAIGAPADRAGGVPGGSVTVLYGAATGLSATRAQQWSQASAGIAGAPADGDRFGAALVAGDLDGDGDDDLAIGVPGDAVNAHPRAGTVHVLAGGAAGLGTSGARQWHQDRSAIPGTTAHDDEFGAALAIGDVDDDGDDELGIGAPGDRIDGRESAGSVTILSPALGSAIGALWHLNRAGVPGVPEAGAGLGASVAIADIDGDGIDDLVAGAPGATVSGRAGAGRALLVMGTVTGLDPLGGGAAIFDQDTGAIGGTAEEGDHLGAALLADDLVLAFGVPDEDVGGRRDAGAVSGSDSITVRGGAPEVPGLPGRDDRFAAAFATGDYDADGELDLIAAAPGAVVGGLVYVIFDPFDAAGASGALVFHQNTPGIRGEASAGDAFGSALL